MALKTRLLVLVRQAVLHDIHEGFQVRQHRTAKQDGNLLHDLDTRVPRLRDAHQGTLVLQFSKEFSKQR